ncbi:MAG: hypothetical protein ACLQM6_08860 [Acidobacteriaceae bacterium]
MLLRNHTGRAFLLCLVAFLFSFAPLHARAQDDTTPAPEKHGRKYKAPPDTSHVEVTVLKDYNKKPIMNAAVIFHPTKDGHDEGNLELKTDPDGKASIDVIPTGSKVTIQVIADGFSTFAQDYQINEANRQIVISLIRPRAQVSAYIDNTGKPAQMKPGEQDPIRPIPKTATPATSSAPSSTAPAAAPSGTAPQP